MGTTLTALLLPGGRAYLAHVGDSRAYLYRDDRLEQLTEDHSWIEEQVRAGFMTPDEARESSLKHIITRSVGFERDVEVDLHVLPILMGDCFLICSDGLSNPCRPRSCARTWPRATTPRCPAGWWRWPTSAAAKTTSPWCWSTSPTTPADAPWP